jgi:hypothetical protein
MWFLFALWVFLCVLVGMYAENHCDRDGLKWGVLALLISPLLAILLLLAMPPVRRGESIGSSLDQRPRRPVQFYGNSKPSGWSVKPTTPRRREWVEQRQNGRSVGVEKQP